VSLALTVADAADLEAWTAGFDGREAGTVRSRWLSVRPLATLSIPRGSSLRAARNRRASRRP